MRVFGAAFVAALFAGMPLANAWPVEQRLAVEQGRERFVSVAAVDWALSRDEKVATIERLEGGEWLVTGKSPGRTFLLLGSQGQMAVWSVHVSAKGDVPPDVPQPLLAAARKACPTLVRRQHRIEVTVPDDTCRGALLTLFRETDAFLARDVTVVYELPALQANLRAIEEALTTGKYGSVTARYVGAGLVLEGTVPQRDQHREVLWKVFDQSVGRVPLDDSIRIQSKP